MQADQLVIFGFNGDLSQRKLMPALARLEEAGRLSDKFKITAVTRKETNIPEYFEKIAKYMPKHVSVKSKETLQQRLNVIVADISKDEDFTKIKESIDESAHQKCMSIMFYFAIPPSLFESTIENMVKVGLNRCATGEAESRLLIEKPFGSDLGSAKQLIQSIENNFGEESVYRIDHYLAKDTVQNILHFRFHNPIFQHLWSTEHIDHIQISAIEEIDIQGRASFYEQTGTLRDMIQGHLLQLLAITTMDEPADMSPGQIRRQRQRLLDAVRPVEGDQDQDKPTAVRAQYSGYRDEVENEASVIETFAAFRFAIDSSRWRDVPIYLRAGKALSEKKTEIRVVFKAADHHKDQNELIFRIQPHEGIVVKITGKQPGISSEAKTVDLNYCMHDADSMIADAYEKILFDSINGDQTLFPTGKEILSSWGIVDAILKSWHGEDSTNDDLTFYDKGSNSPSAQSKILLCEDHGWDSSDDWTCAVNKT